MQSYAKPIVFALALLSALPGVLNFQHRIWITMREFLNYRNDESLNNSNVSQEELQKYENKLCDSRNYFIATNTYHFKHTHKLSVGISRLQGLISTLRNKIPPEVIVNSKEFELALAHLIIMLSPVTPHFCSELWSGLQSAPRKLNDSSKVNWSANVIEQKWPSVDDQYKLSLQCKVRCLAAHSERSRQRSGPIKSVPIAADIKRDVNFDCPEEFGYYPHPTDCTLYYVCVFGGALLESCTGGLMYSHELQTCDWPRNVGCDATSAIGNDDLERLNDRAPPPPPQPRRKPPPPPPRVQPNPVVTSRGQPRIKIEREPINQHYEKQQQLYAEVDDLPPVEEIESDRQQRVYRGQPSTIGQVQKDRDGYVGNVGRTVNSNIIPASIPQNSGKIGAFSFGSQVDERRTSRITEAPQIYRNAIDKVTDSLNDRQLDVNVELDSNDLDAINIRTKRGINDLKNVTINTDDSSNTSAKAIRRSDKNDDMGYFDENADLTDDINEDNLDDVERGKRQIRYNTKNNKNSAKIWNHSKPVEFIDFQQYNYNPNIQNTRHQSIPSNFEQNSYFPSSLKPDYSNDNSFSTANPFIFYQENIQPQKPFKASLPDPFEQKYMHNPINSATHIITKSPPISALKSNENPFASLAGGFYNNAPQPQKVPSQSNKILKQSDFRDSSQLPSTVVTGKPVRVSTIPNYEKYSNQKEQNIYNRPTQNNYGDTRNTKQNLNYVTERPRTNENIKEQNESYEEYEPEDENSSETDDVDDDDSKSDIFPPPREFTHPTNKFANIENPFASPNFDFDAFLDKLRDDHYKAVGVTTKKPKTQNQSYKTINDQAKFTTPAYQESNSQKSNLNYDGMSTPRPFSIPSGPSFTIKPEQYRQSGNTRPEHYQTAQEHNTKVQYDNYRFAQENAAVGLESARPNLKPPNFKDEREIPLSYNFNRPTNQKPKIQQIKHHGAEQQIYSVTQKPYVLYSSTGSPILLSTPKQQYLLRPEQITRVPAQTHSNRSPHLVNSHIPDQYYILKQSTPSPLTTVNENLASPQMFWQNQPSTSYKSYDHTLRPNTVSEMPKLENLFSQTYRPSTVSNLDQVSFSNYQRDISTTTVQSTPKKRPIPKPSPEMNDYYYDDEDDPYYEPPVKSKYMPSSEVMPQRPPMAQNYLEYEDLEEQLSKPYRPLQNQPTRFKYSQQSVNKNQNDVSGLTKDPIKSMHAMITVVPVMVNSVTLTPGIMRPEISNYEIHHSPKNRTMFIRKPMNSVSGPNTLRPPKYLNQTTLRPYTVRHRLAIQTTAKTPISQSAENTQNRGKTRHQNLVAQIKATTMKDNQDKPTKIRLDAKYNSLEPTESVSPVSYSATPKPKMLYNGSESYSPDQFDPYYAVYDEDGVLYKDNDYVQQYNSASIRPAVQQTYRGTPPPARRPVETFSTRPSSADDYDDALIQGQINNQNQYRPSIRQPTRGEGNDLGYEHIPSSVRTTAFDVTSISTTSSTTSTTTTTTTTTTPRPTRAPFTEAMIPSRYNSRLSNDENLNSGYKTKANQSLKDEPSLPALSTSNPVINFSSQAKPFEITDNSYRLKQTSIDSDSFLTSKLQNGTPNSKRNFSLQKKYSQTNKDSKPVSLTTGFSIRRNPNNSNNPYTLTVLSRPFDEYNKLIKDDNKPNVHDNVGAEESIEDSVEIIKSRQQESSGLDRSVDISMRRKDTGEEYDIPKHVYNKPKSLADIETTTTSTTKYYLKTVIKRPAPFSNDSEAITDSTENVINSDALIENALENKNQLDTTSQNNQYDYRAELPDSHLSSSYKLGSDFSDEDKYYLDSPTTSSTPVLQKSQETSRSYDRQKSKPSYFSYRLIDEDIPDQTTEVFSGPVKKIIQAFFDNLKSSAQPTKPTEKKLYQPTVPSVEKTVNIGYQKKINKFSEDVHRKNPIKRIQVVTEPTESVFSSPNTLQEQSNLASIKNPTTKKHKFVLHDNSETTSIASVYNDNSSFESKFNDFVPFVPETQQNHRDQSSLNKNSELSQRFLKIISENKPVPNRGSITYSIDKNSDNLPTKNLVTNEETKIEYDDDKVVKDPPTTTTTTTAKTTTTTVKLETTTVTKNVSFPTRASRVNPAIKLAATNLGGGRRSYQSTSKCSSENNLQPNPKCNEIKYQRPTNTRGRGSAHYSTSGTQSESQHQPNRGTPPTRSRPTLKPSTSIVSKSTEFVDIYAYPPSRPQPIYPTPTPDKTAAKCRKDVCQLPDCYCGGKEIPGDLPVDSVPQMVLLTFDDSVNDLNKGLYTDLFEKGRVNPNGCPIAATFYVSHEWTDYSQVQNLYSAGHEMASHTVSHSFGEQFSQKKWNREVGGQREILAAYGGVKLEEVRGMRAPFLSVGGNKMFKMLYDSNFTYDSSLPVYENKPPSWPYTLDYKLFHDCMIPPCPTKSYPGVWEVPMVMWQDLNGGRCSMGDACANPPDAEGVYKMILKNFDRHYTTNRAPFGLYYHAAWFTQPHHKEGFIMFLDFINQMSDVWIITNWQALQWVRDPTPISRVNNFQPFQCNYQDRPKKCNNPKVCNLWHKSGVRYMRTCQPCPEIYPWTGKTGIRSSRIDNDIEE